MQRREKHKIKTGPLCDDTPEPLLNGPNVAASWDEKNQESCVKDQSYGVILRIS